MHIASAMCAMLLLCACRSQAVPDQSGAPAPKSSAAQPTADFNLLVSKGDYAGAIAFVEKSNLAPDEKDGINGNLILDGLADPAASTRPPYTLSDGFARLERAAAAGRVQSVADLRAKFTVGVNYEGKSVLMAPVARLGQCWAKVEAGTQSAAFCIALRQRLHVPEH
jgi:hypothetical protein